MPLYNPRIIPQQGPNVWQELGRQGMGFGQLLMGMDAEKKALARQEERDAIEAQRYEDTQSRLDRQEREAAAMRDYQMRKAGDVRVQPGGDELASIREIGTDMRDSLKPGVVGSQPMPGFGAAIRDLNPKFSLGEAEYRYDPTQDRALGAEVRDRRWQEALTADQREFQKEMDERNFAQQTELAQFQASLRPQSSPPPSLIQTEDGYAWADPSNRSITPVDGIRPKGKDAGVHPSQSAMSAIDNYESEINKFFNTNKGPLQRMFSAGDRAGLEAAQTAVKFEAKNLFELGALQEADLKVLEGLIGDPLSLGAVSYQGRAPALAKLTEARKLIERKAQEAGVSVPSQTSTVAPDAQRRAAANLTPNGYSPDNPFLR